MYVRLMALSKKLSSIDENISCDPAYLMKVSSDFHQKGFSFFFFVVTAHCFLSLWI